MNSVIAGGLVNAASSSRGNPAARRIELDRCTAHHLECVDAASALAHDPAMLYDEAHFTNANSRQVAGLLARYLAVRPPERIRGASVSGGMMPRLLMVLALSALPAAARAQDAAVDSTKTIREFRGTYQRGFEQSWFRPCGAPRDDNMWWVTLTDDALRQRDSLLARITAPATNGLAVRWKGTVGAKMPAGMMGRGSRYILVTSIEDIWPLPAEGACSTAVRT